MNHVNGEVKSAEGGLALTRRDLMVGAAAMGSSLVLGKGLGVLGGHTIAKAADGVLDVAIIGAGLAGLATARELHRLGARSFVVLEGRDRVGGRTLNLDIGGGYVVSGGAEWVGPTQTAVLELAKELGVGTHPTYTGRRTSSSEPMKESALSVRLGKLAATVPLDKPWKAERAAEWDAMTLADWIERNEVSPREVGMLRSAAGMSLGAAPNMLSFLYFLFYIRSGDSLDILEGFEGGAQQDRINGGTQILSLKMAEELGDYVRLGTPVTTIRNWGGDTPVELATPKGTVKARRVVVALMPALAERIKFEPALPAMRASVQREWPSYAMGYKAALAYEEPFWRSKGLALQLGGGGPVTWAYDNSPPDLGMGAISMFVDRLELPDARDAVEARGRLLAKELAKGLGEEALEYTRYVEQDWAWERYSKGCVSPLAPGFLTSYGEAICEPVGNLYWAGTETAEVWCGYMDGAVRSGKRVAQQIASLLKRKADAS